MNKNSSRLTKGQKVTILMGIGTVCLLIILQLLIRRWFSPDIRYKEGVCYLFEDRTVTSVEIKNYGHKVAKSIKTFVLFNSTILDIQISEGRQFRIIDGGIGKNKVNLEVERLVPRDKILIFFTVEEVQRVPFIEKVEYDEGLGKTGIPQFWRFLGIVLLYLLLTPLLWWISELLRKPRLEKHYSNIEKVVELAFESAKSEDTENVFKEKLDSALVGTKFRTETLKKIAFVVFNRTPRPEDEIPF